LRKPQPVGGSASGLNGDDAADPLSHAAPDVELAEAQLALGRPELADETPAEHEANERELEDEATEYDDLEDEDEDEDGSAHTLAVAPLSTGREARPAEDEAHPPGHRPNILARAFGFLQGSWRELQRVQWPDRRQVMQATGVVIGFVIIAGVFLGVADVLAQHLMNYVLEGHW
jgi:preprotein translocase subunit SecE